MDPLLVKIVVITFVGHCKLVIELTFDRIAELCFMVNFIISVSIVSGFMVFRMSYFYFDIVLGKFIVLVDFIFEIPDMSFRLSDLGVN